MDTLPAELIYRVMLNTDFDDLKALCEVNSTYFSICNDSNFWINKTIYDFEVSQEYIMSTGLKPYLAYQMLMMLSTQSGSNLCKGLVEEYYVVGKSGNLALITYYLNKFVVIYQYHP